MKLFFGLILPLILICLPTAFQIIFTIRRVRHKTSMNLMTSFFLAFVVGLFMPLLAFNMAVDAVTADWPKDEPHCLTGFVGILLIGYLIDIAGCFIIAIVGRTMFVERPNEKKQNITETTEPTIKFNKIIYSSDKGEITIEQEYQNPNIGEKVFIYNRPAPNDKYKIGFLSFIEIEDGRIVDISST